MVAAVAAAGPGLLAAGLLAAIMVVGELGLLAMSACTPILYNWAFDGETGLREWLQSLLPRSH